MTVLPYIGPEDAMQIAVTQYLKDNAYPEVLWYHSSPRAIDARTGRRNKDRGVIAGLADFELLHRGRTTYLELKTATGRQSPAQKEFEKRAIRAGGSYRVARSVPEAIEILIELGLAQPDSGVARKFG